MTPTLQSITIGFVVLSVIFFVLQKLWPSVPGQKTFRKGFVTDFFYWVFTPLVTRANWRNSAYRTPCQRAYWVN